MGVRGCGPTGPIIPPRGGSATAPPPKRPTNRNCRGCGAMLKRVECAYCGRRANPAEDLIVPDPADDPKRKIAPRTVMF